MKLFDAVPIGEEPIGTMHGPSTHPVYPPFPHGVLLDDLRRALNIPIHAASDALGIDPVDFYALRRGRKTFYAPDDFTQAVEALVKRAQLLYPPDRKIFEAAQRLFAKVCIDCGETREDIDPELSTLPNRGPLCCYCGYWNISPGPKREEHRAERRRKLEQP